MCQGEISAAYNVWDIEGERRIRRRKKEKEKLVTVSITEKF